MNKILFKNLITLLVNVISGIICLLISNAVYLTFLCVDVLLCVIAGLFNFTDLKIFIRMFRNITNIDVNATFKSYIIGVFTNLGGYLIGGIITYLM